MGLGGDAKVTLESIARFSDDAGGFFHAELGGIVTVPAARGIELGFGYRHVEERDHGGARPDEDRLRQQVTLALGGGFAARLRSEQRFHQSGGETGWRIRPQLRFTAPLGKGVAFFAAHEDFVNLNATGWGQRRGYERMRNAAGLTVPLAPRLSGDLGYLNQYRFGRGGARDRMDHAATFSLTLAL